MEADGSKWLPHGQELPLHALWFLPSEHQNTVLPLPPSKYYYAQHGQRSMDSADWSAKKIHNQCAAAGSHLLLRADGIHPLSSSLTDRACSQHW